MCRWWTSLLCCFLQLQNENTRHQLNYEDIGHNDLLLAGEERQVHM